MNITLTSLLQPEWGSNIDFSNQLYVFVEWELADIMTDSSSCLWKCCSSRLVLGCQGKVECFWNSIFRHSYKPQEIYGTHKQHKSVFVHVCHWDDVWQISFIRIEKSPFSRWRRNSKANTSSGSHRNNQTRGDKKQNKKQKTLAVWTKVPVSHLFRDHQQQYVW